MTGKGQIVNTYRDENGKLILMIQLDEIPVDLDDVMGIPVEIKVTKPRKKRSLDANSYFWELCGKIADKMSDDGTITTKDDVYRECVKQVGVFRDIPMLGEGIDTIRKAWEMHGTGWVTEIVDYLPDNSGYLVRCYYGSSTYNTKQMSRLIDNIVQDAQTLGIDTRTPAEIANLLSLWQQAKDKERN
jgi:hypothetical protein